jgi:hypothetical protein
MSSVTLQGDPSVDPFFNVVETETLALFEHFSFEFLEEFNVFVPAETRRTHARGRVHARAHVFLALCLRLVVAIINYERGDNPGSTVITV